MNKTQLSTKTKIGYGAGDLGFNLMFTGVSLYLMFFYTDVLGIPVKTAGLIFMGAMVWDAITDPIMGLVAQHTKTRFGSYRPYLLFASTPLVLSYVLMFWQPKVLSLDVATYAFASHILFRTAYTLVSIPYSSLMARLTSDSMQRNALAGFRMIGATLGGLTVAILTLELVKLFGDGDSQLGFQKTAILFGSIALVCLMIVFFTCKEHENDIVSEPPKLGETLKMLKCNIPFLQLIMAILVISSCLTFFTKTLVYFYKYNLGAEDKIGLALFVYIGCVSLLTPLWMFVTSKTSKRFVWLFGSVIYVFAMLAFYIMPIHVDNALYFIMFAGVGASVFPLTYWSMLPDTVEYGQWKTGIRAESFVFGMTSLSQKIALGLGVGALGLILEQVGFVANTTLTTDTMDSIKELMTLIPGCGALLAGIIMYRYPIDSEYHNKIVRNLMDKE